MPKSVWPRRQQPTRLPCPWDSPGKNTGVGCHFLLQCMKVKSESGVAQSCLTLRYPMDCIPPGSSVHGILQAKVMEWVAIAFSEYLSISIYIHIFLSTHSYEFRKGPFKRSLPMFRNKFQNIIITVKLFLLITLVSLFISLH